ncbi:MAG: arginine decarboxylase, pyruvoyl-dependent [Candidatus Bipolaricaulota bacterium]|nr:arginine decarboxylase, pyruvoyl-dependent [Candidatus Bipolaricaulota bacterium]MDW8126241.1 arginine decarboxylase, pyruvoyl-dependent [Candidatus Bipolaricaulota bacterium]
MPRKAKPAPAVAEAPVALPWPLVPRKVFFTRGVGRHRDELRSFELALRDAGIEKLNLVHVSSILPPGCKIIPRSEGLKEIKPGQIAFCVFSRCASNEPHRLIAAAIGCAIPADPNAYGYLSEYHAFGENEKQAGDKAEDLAASMLASTLGIEFDDELVWDEKKEIWRISGKIVRTMNVTQSAIVDNKGYTTVLAAAVFLF